MRMKYTFAGAVWRFALAAICYMQIYNAWIAGVYASMALYFVIGTVLIVRGGICLRGYNAAEKARREKTEQMLAEHDRQMAEDEERKKQRAEWILNHGIISTKVAGVTFNNDDGSSRQDYLKELLTSGVNRVELRPYTYNSEPAIYVVADGLCVGNVPRDKVSAVLNVMDRITSVNLTADTFVLDDDDDERSGERLYHANLDIIYLKTADEIACAQ